MAKLISLIQAFSSEMEEDWQQKVYAAAQSRLGVPGLQYLRVYFGRFSGAGTASGALVEAEFATPQAASDQFSRTLAAPAGATATPVQGREVLRFLSESDQVVQSPRRDAGWLSDPGRNLLVLSLWTLGVCVVLLGWVLRLPEAPQPSFLAWLALLLIAANIVVLLPNLDPRWFIRGFLFAILPLALLGTDVAGSLLPHTALPLWWTLIGGILVAVGNIAAGNRL